MSHPTAFATQQSQQTNSYPKWWLYRAACYLGGEGITFGEPIVPHLSKMYGKSSIDVDVVLTPHVDLVHDNLDIFADSSMDHIFIGPRLELLKEPEKKLREFTRKLRKGGHLVIAQKINNPDKQALFRFDSDNVRTMVGEIGRWKAKAAYEREGTLLQIYKKIDGKKGIEPASPPSARKRACICRYGAMGDMVIITPLIKALKADGFDVTMNISPYALPIIENNPHISNIVIQEREMIPNPELGPYWKEWENDYDRYINLSESLEGRFLKVEGRRDFYTTQEWRRKTGEHNYYDYTMRAGGYPDKTGQRGELFFTNAERRDADKFFSRLRGKFVIVWALNGSSHHKMYAQMEMVVGKWLDAHPSSVIITVGDRVAKMLEFKHSQLINKAGEWSVRESLIAAKLASLVIGPETMMTNVAGSLGTPTITLLSHSTHEALCKYWPNDYCLAPDIAAAPCYPCFQLHYSRESCPIKQAIDDKTGAVLAEAPACALDGISATRLLARMEEVHSKHFNAESDILNRGALRSVDPQSANYALQQ